jgi:hypothetical protein
MGFEDTWDRALIGNQDTQKCLNARVRDPEHGGLIGKSKPIAGHFEETLLRRSYPIWS